MTWANEFTANVACHSSTVEPKKPKTRPLQPPISQHVTPRAHGATQS